jgi:hypothetical protein
MDSAPGRAESRLFLSKVFLDARQEAAVVFKPVHHNFTAYEEAGRLLPGGAQAKREVQRW